MQTNNNVQQAAKVIAVTVSKFLLVVSFGRFCGKNLGFGFGFLMKPL